jgi:hypothetical protein
VHRSLGVGLARAEHSGRELRLVDRVWIVLCLEADAVVLDVRRRCGVLRPPVERVALHAWLRRCHRHPAATGPVDELRTRHKGAGATTVDDKVVVEAWLTAPVDGAAESGREFDAAGGGEIERRALYGCDLAGRNLRGDTGGGSAGLSAYAHKDGGGGGARYNCTLHGWLEPACVMLQTTKPPTHHPLTDLKLIDGGVVVAEQLTPVATHSRLTIA